MEQRRRAARSAPGRGNNARFLALAALALALGSASAEAHDGGLPCAYDEFYPGADALEVSFLAESAMCQGVQPSAAVDLSDERGRRAVERAADASPAVSVLHLGVAEAVHPHLGDVFALSRGEALLANGDARAAEEAFSDALASSDPSVRVQARVGRTIALLRRDHREAEEEARKLRFRYPELPNQPALMLELGAYNQRRGDTSDALNRYRWLIVQAPGTPEADEAQTRIDAMAAEGVRVRPLAPLEVVTRAERLFARGPMAEARRAIAALEEAPPANRTLRAKAFALMAKLARHEGRFEDASRYYGLSARSGSFGDAEDIERRQSRAEDVADATRDTAEAAEAQLRSLSRGRALRAISTARLMTMSYVAARGGLRDELNRFLGALQGRTLAPRHRMDIVLRTLGVADDEALLQILGDTGERAGRLGVQARYYTARLLARLGRSDEARTAFEHVVENDRSELTWYATWAAQYLENAFLEGTETAASSETLREGRAREGEVAPEPTVAAVDDAALAARLEALSEETRLFPWVARAAAFLRLGDRQGAAHQLYETYLAYRDGIGRPIRRAGLPSVAMGKSRLRPRAPFAARRDRAKLSDEAREELRQVAVAIDAYGAATGFGGASAIQARPRAHARLVYAAAERHDLDPNLLFAVMRVESVYQAEIVSYAGAIGLAQIMPRTGTLIAHELEREGFTTADLLNPATNLEFAAWYLRSLIDRFEGHLPLAIASYNGGPHNVRRWLRNHPRDLPMDAFLEHIPFEQTHRYVRRVLGHYEAYRAQQGLEMIRLDARLPTPAADPIGF